MKFFKQLFIFSALTSVFAVGVAYAATLNTDGDIKVRNVLTITETTGLNFGVIEKPTSTVTAIVSPAGAESGTATYIDTADVSQGVYSIAGSFLETVEISVTDLGNEAGFEFTDVRGNYGSTTNGDLLAGITGQDAPGAGTNLSLGATLTVQNTVVEGDYTPGFQIEVNYD